MTSTRAVRPTTPLRAWAVAVAALAAVAAGCVDDAADAEPEVARSSLHGWVLDPIFVPVRDARVQLAGTGLVAPTDVDGHYEFATLPDDELLTLVVDADGFERRSVTLHQPVTGVSFVRNFSLERTPPAEPLREVIEFAGFISCGIIAIVGHQHGQNPHNHTWVDCGGGNTTQDNVWLLPVKASLTAAVFEVFWDAGTPFAEQLVIFVEGAGVDDGEDVFFSFYEGQSGMKGTVSRLQAAQYYGAADGLVRFTILPGAPEQDVAVAAHINQRYEVFATLFYGETPSPTYSFADEAS
jgi:hypothetical protein